MQWTTGESVTLCFTTFSSTGNVDADSPPTGTLVIDGVDDGASVTVTKKATGDYKAQVTLPAITDGSTIEIRIAATVAGIAGKLYLDAGQGATIRPSKKLLKYVQLMTRSDAANATDNATEKTEINADGGSGGGNFDPSNTQALQSLLGISGNVLAVLNDTGGTDGVKLASSTDVYHADIDFTRDQSNTQDEYTVKWLKNGVPQSTVADTTIQVVSRDGSDLIASTAMTDVGGGLLTYDATGAERQTQGEAVDVIVTATINAATRTFSRLLGRDST